jgi:hypothetical protein
MGTTPRWPVVLGSDAGVMLGPVATNGEFLCSVKVIRAITTTIAARTARNVRTARGGMWTHVQVGAILHPFVASAGA